MTNPDWLAPSDQGNIEPTQPLAPMVRTMTQDDIPEIIFSPLCRRIEVDGHWLNVEIYCTAIDPAWFLDVENEFGTLTTFEEPFLADGLAWRAFEDLVAERGLAAFLGPKDKRKPRR
jgi:hypothetical protein